MKDHNIVLMHVIRIKYGDLALLAFGLRGTIKCPELYEACVDPKKVEHIEDPAKVQIYFTCGVSFNEMNTVLDLSRVA